MKRFAIIEVLEAEYHKEIEDQAEAALEGEKGDVLKEDKVEDVEHAMDAPNEGRNAKFDLLIAAAGEQFLNLTMKDLSAYVTSIMHVSVITFKHLKIKNFM
jgi:hypothetical protein